MSKATRATLLAILLTASLQVYSAETSSIQVGAIGISRTSLYEGVSHGTQAFPLLLVEHGRFHLRGTQAGYRVFERGDTSVSLVTEFGSEGYKSGDSNFLDSMRNRRAAAEAGATLTQRLSRGTIELKLTHDISNAHKGHSARIKYDHSVLASPMGMIHANVAGEFLSARQGNYYFGVTTDEATEDRLAFQQGSVRGMSIGINGTRRITDRVSVLGQVDYRLLHRDLTDSPIVRRNDQMVAFIGMAYRF